MYKAPKTKPSNLACHILLLLIHCATRLMAGICLVLEKFTKQSFVALDQFFEQLVPKFFLGQLWLFQTRNLRGAV